ncbi:MAG: Hsp20/alpha crystallin family protein [Myxococcota bacterium]
MAKSDEKSLIKPSDSFFKTIDQLQEKIQNRAYEIFDGRDDGEGDHLADWFQAESDVLSEMALRVEEEDDQYIVEGEFPEFAADEIDVQIEGDTLSLAGSHKSSSSSKTEAGSSERHSEVNFLRRMLLSDDIDGEGMEARFENGKLRVVIPRRKA